MVEEGREIEENGSEYFVCAPSARCAMMMPNLLLQQLNRSQAGTRVEEQATASSPGEGSEGKLRGEVQLLKEQLKSAYEKAAEATSHIAQYQALAESSNQALEAMQASPYPLPYTR